MQPAIGLKVCTSFSADLPARSVEFNSLTYVGVSILLRTQSYEGSESCMNRKCKQLGHATQNILTGHTHRDMDATRNSNMTTI